MTALSEIKSESRLKRRYILENLHCAGCASKIEKAVGEAPFIQGASLSFATKKLVVMAEAEAAEEVIETEIKRIVHQFEPGVKVVSEVENQSEGDHGHSHNHGHDHGLSGQKVAIIRVALGLALFAVGFIMPEGLPRMGVYLAAYLVAGYDVVWDALSNLRRGRLFDEKFLMAVATFAAWGIGEYPEAAAVMLFYKTGELFEGYAVDKSRGHIKRLVDIKANEANRVTPEGIERIDTELVKVGDVLLVKTGEKVPLDGEVIDGSALMDSAAITGEPVPFKVHRGDRVYGGFINTEGALRLRVEKVFADSTVGRIMDLIENASMNKAQTERFITRFARFYTPVVVGLSAALAVLPPLFGAGSFSTWIYRAAVFLVVSCPCALVISIPLGYFGGIGRASSQGILVKGGNYLEAIKDVDTLLMDKTGTVTEGVFEVVEVTAASGFSEAEVLEYAAAVENLSGHPVAQAVVRHHRTNLVDVNAVGEVREIAGKGIQAVYHQRHVAVGNQKLMADLGLTAPPVDEVGTVAYVALDGVYAGYILVADRIREEAVETLKKLRSLGIRQIFMLTGDRRETAEKIGAKLGMDGVYAELLPDMKVALLQKIKAEEAKGRRVAFVGDGINDAPSLALADVGISMGGLGADLAIEASDVVVMKDDLRKLPELLTISRATDRVVWQNIGFALGFKALVLILGALGMATMWEAVFADVGVAVLAVLNASRINRG